MLSSISQIQELVTADIFLKLSLAHFWNGTPGRNSGSLHLWTLHTIGVQVQEPRQYLMQKASKPNPGPSPVFKKGAWCSPPEFTTDC